MIFGEFPLRTGHIPLKLRSEIVESLNILDMVDLDWNNRETWNEVVLLANMAKKHRMPIPGMIDRMILLSTLNAQASLASCDQALLRLAEVMKISIWPGMLKSN